MKKVTDHTQGALCPPQLPTITLVLRSVWAVITRRRQDSMKHISLLSHHPPLFVCFLGVCLFQLTPSFHPPTHTSVWKRAEPFHKLVNSMQQQAKGHSAIWTVQFYPRRCQLWIPPENLSPMSMQPWGGDRAITHTAHHWGPDAPLQHCEVKPLRERERERRGGELVRWGLWPLCASRQNILCWLAYCSPAALRLLWSPLSRLWGVDFIVLLTLE